MVWEPILGAVATAILSAGSAAAVSASKRALETREAVLTMKQRVESLSSGLDGVSLGLRELKTNMYRDSGRFKVDLERQQVQLEGLGARVSRLEGRAEFRYDPLPGHPPRFET